jgi:hypothetical protein
LINLLSNLKNTLSLKSNIDAKRNGPEKLSSLRLTNSRHLTNHCVFIIGTPVKTVPQFRLISMKYRASVFLNTLLTPLTAVALKRRKE